MKFRKKPVVVEAFQLPPAGCEQSEVEKFHDWANAVQFDNWVSDRDETIVVVTLEGDMTAKPGDWIIRGIEGEFYPCKGSIFAKTYEPVDG